MRKINLAILLIAVCAIHACKNPESRAVDSKDSGSMDISGENAAKNNDQDGNDRSSETAPGDITHKSSADDDSAFFIKEAGVGGMMEVEMGNIALKNASNEKVKAFAKQMVADHSKANQELMGIAKKAGIIIPTAIPEEKRAHLDMLKKATGAEFDKQYMDMMVNDHQKTVELFKSGQDVNREEVMEFAKKTTPVIEGHFKMAKEIMATLK
ncbi:DUF4142 domain-containing protein [Pedobacter sp.]|uniref:DUF4142 domain-containing protein n=1 Tax=Pedobacter sp. TaxID=1411316 RepID=UPI003D7F875E